MVEGPAEPLVTAPEVVLVANVHARRGAEAFERAREELVRAGALLRSSVAVDDPSELGPRVAEAVARGARRVVVAGGDGTLATAAGAIAGTGAELGVLPLGTANDFARGLGLPLDDLPAAARVCVTGAPRRVDLGRVGGAVFLNAASVGLSSGLTERLDGGLKQVAGPLAYPVAAATEAARAQPFHLRLEVDGEIHEGEALQVVIGNGRFHGGGTLVAPDARPDDRRLDAWVLWSVPREDETRARRRLELLGRLATLALRLVRGRHLDHPAVLHVRGRRIALHTVPPLPIDADGELRGETPAVLTVEPGALAVLAPA